MQFTTSALAAVLAFTSTAAASPLQARQETLQDWQVTAVFVGTPSGRPGSYPWATIKANVTDPNTLNLGNDPNGNPVTASPSSGINCEAKYFTKGESPLGRTWPCDSGISGYWVMTVLPGSKGQYSSQDFNLKFTHVPDFINQGQQYTGKYEAEGSFKVGDNLGGTCGGSGVCSWGLQEEKKPFAIKAKKV